MLQFITIEYLTKGPYLAGAACCTLGAYRESGSRLGWDPGARVGVFNPRLGPGQFLILARIFSQHNVMNLNRKFCTFLRDSKKGHPNPGQKPNLCYGLPIRCNKTLPGVCWGVLDWWFSWLLACPYIDWVVGNIIYLLLYFVNLKRFQ